MTTVLDSLLESLFFGTGAWLGVLLLLILVFGVAMIHKFAKAVMCPVSMFIAFWYFDNLEGDNNVMWIAILFMFVAIIMGVWAVGDKS